MDTTSLIVALGSDDRGQRAAAAEQLAQLGPGAQPAAVPLVEACEYDDEQTHEWVVAALEGLGPPRAADAARLAELVLHPSLNSAWWAATLLGRLQREAAPAVDALAAALATHAEISVRQRAAWALGQIGPPAAAARDTLEAAAASPNPRLASLASAALQEIAR